MFKVGDVRGLYRVVGLAGRDIDLECTCGRRVRLRRCSFRAEVGGCRACGGVRNGVKRRKHGHSGEGPRCAGRTPEYVVWLNMRRRVANPTGKNRAYASVTVDPRWDDYAVFFKDMGSRPSKRHSIERKDGALGYSPENCVWALPVTQSNNRRNNIRITYLGVTRTVGEWATLQGIKYATLRMRFKAGWSPERALTKEVRRGTRC